MWSYSKWEELRLIKRFFLPVKRIVKESFWDHMFLSCSDKKECLSLFMVSISKRSALWTRQFILSAYRTLRRSVKTVISILIRQLWFISWLRPEVTISWVVRGVSARVSCYLRWRPISKGRGSCSRGWRWNGWRKTGRYIRSCIWTWMLVIIKILPLWLVSWMSSWRNGRLYMERRNRIVPWRNVSVMW